MRDFFFASVSGVMHLRNERIAFVPFVGRGLLLPHMNICVLLDLGLLEAVELFITELIGTPFPAIMKI